MAKVSLIIEAESVEELHARIRDVLFGQPMPVAETPVYTVVGNSTELEPLTAAEAVEIPRPARKPRAKKNAEPVNTPAPVEAASATEPAPAPALTEGVVRAAFTALAGKKGMAQAIATLQPFAERIGDLRPDQYAEVMKAVEEAGQ